MKRLRHPVRAIREPFGTAGLVVACVALVLATTGAAFAAGALSGKQKKEVEKIAKKFAGKPGAAGAAGAQGAAGPAGAAGKDGTAGSPGDDGESVTLGTATGCGAAGGTKLTVGSSSKEVCNGEEGEEGEPGPPGNPGTPGAPGSPWTAGGTLPAGAQETGTWMASGGIGKVEVPISFPIPLSDLVSTTDIYYGAGLDEAEIETEPGVFEKTEFQKHCAEAALFPSVRAGLNRTLCIYFASATSMNAAPTSFERVTAAGAGGLEGAGTAGGFIELNLAEAGTIYGSFAVSGG